jgi:acetyltransferase-like isoleucine patch superfamily enzyme
VYSKSRIPVRQILTEGALPSGLQRRLYRRRGYRIASDVDLSPGVVIDAEEVDIGPGTSIGFGTVIRGRRVRIGRRVTIGSVCFFEGRDIDLGDDTTLREQVYVGGPLLPDSELKLGKRVRVFQMCFLNPSRRLSIDDDTGVGGRSSIFTHGSWQSMFDGYPVAFEPVTIGRNVWLPWHVFILPGVEIGDNATIGAGSVVNRSIPSGVLAAGIPAKVLRGEGDWPPRLGIDEQWNLARSMTETFADYLRGNGTEVRSSEADGRLRLDVSYCGRRWSVLLVQGPEPPVSEADILIHLRGRPSQPPPGCAWFSLLERVRGGPSDELAAEVADFIARYGVRFAPVDEE